MATQPLVDTVSSFLARHSDRRGFLRRSALVGTALAAAPTAYALRPGSAYAAVCSCSGSVCDCGSRCCDGYTEFCCTLNGQNQCPPGAIMAGWWKADGSGFCGSNAPRYYMDCNVSCGGCGCGGSGTCAGSCSGTPCGCANGSCGNRKAGCTRFRYGQCNQATPCVGPIICRVVSCSPPWSFDPSCTTTVATDNNTRFHDAACLHVPPRPKPALATFHDGVWRFRRRVESGNPEITFSYGQAGDVPLVGDWNGDGGVGIGVRRGSTFILRNSTSAGAPNIIFDWGRPSDRVITGDWNGNGTTGVGLRRGRTWYLKNFLDGRPHEIQFDWGRPDDIPLVGDWNGDGRVGVGILRGSTWYLKNRLDSSPHDIQFTWAPPAPPPDPLQPTPPPDVPVALDWNDNGTTGVGLVRATADALVWYTKNALDGAQNQRQLSFGLPGDIPLGVGSASLVTTAVTVALTLVVALLALLVVGLLRSHAEILRSLHELGIGEDGTTSSGTRSPSFQVRPGVSLPRGEGSGGVDDLAGVDPWGDPTTIAVAGASHRTLLAFLSSGCLTCQDFWEAFADPSTLGLRADVRPVIVVKDPAHESVARIQDLAPEAVPVIASDQAWETYSIPVAPYFVLVDGPTERVLGEGAAATWEQVRNLLNQALDDLGAAEADAVARERRAAAVRLDERAEEELRRAGITPGHPSLHGDQTGTG